MNVKRMLLAALAVFVTIQVLDFLIHSLLLASMYEETTEIWRPDMMQLMWIMYITSAFLSFLFVYIFTKGHQGKGVIEGAKYGFLIGLLIAVIGILNQYVIYPIPLNMAIIWMVSGLIEFIVAGIVVALIYKPKTL